MKWNIKQLSRYCLMDTGDILRGKPYYYRDNNADIIAIAHADTVAQGEKTFLSGQWGGEPAALSINLDDRLGVYTVLDVIAPVLKIDILITDNEEIGQSTILDFQSDYPDKKYKWAIEFDRAGTDAVTYKHNRASWLRAIKSVFRLDYGSYSDIADWYLSSAVNIGIGYYDAHTDICHAIAADWSLQIERFFKFFSRYKDIEFPYQPPQPKHKRQSIFSFPAPEQHYCWLCGLRGVAVTYNDIADAYICDNCKHNISLY